MEHLIYQLSTEPIEKEDFITEESFEISEVSDFCAYLQKIDDRQIAINSFPFMKYFTLKGEVLTFKGIGDLVEVWDNAVKRDYNVFNVLNDVLRWRLSRDINTPFTYDRFFVEDLASVPQASSDFIEYLSRKKVGTQFYIGGIIKYCI